MTPEHVGCRNYGMRRASRNYCALSPENLITLTHFSVSAAMNRLNSVGEQGNTEPPRSASRTLTLESARVALISWLSLSTISVGVFAGAPMPYHWFVS